MDKVFAALLVCHSNLLAFD